jgi:hypothetical protein
MRKMELRYINRGSKYFVIERFVGGEWKYHTESHVLDGAREIARRLNDEYPKILFRIITIFGSGLREDNSHAN